MKTATKEQFYKVYRQAGWTDDEIDRMWQSERVWDDDKQQWVFKHYNDDTLFGDDVTERRLVNEAINNGGVFIVHTAMGDYQLDHVTDDWNYITHPIAEQCDYWNRRTWAGCNDSEWQDIVKQAKTFLEV